MNRVRYRDLSNPLKVAVCFAWAWLILLSVSFVAGLISGIMGLT